MPQIPPKRRVGGGFRSLIPAVPSERRVRVEFRSLILPYSPKKEGRRGGLGHLSPPILPKRELGGFRSLIFLHSHPEKRGCGEALCHLWCPWLSLRPHLLSQEDVGRPLLPVVVVSYLRFKEWKSVGSQVVGGWVWEHPVTCGLSPSSMQGFPLTHAWFGAGSHAASNSYIILSPLMGRTWHGSCSAFSCAVFGLCLCVLSPFPAPGISSSRFVLSPCCFSQPL